MSHTPHHDRHQALALEILADALIRRLDPGPDPLREVLAELFNQRERVRRGLTEQGRTG